MRKDNDQRIYLNDDDPTVVYLKNVIDDPDIQVGEHTYYHDEKNGFCKKQRIVPLSRVPPG